MKKSMTLITITALLFAVNILSIVSTNKAIDASFVLFMVLCAVLFVAYVVLGLLGSTSQNPKDSTALLHYSDFSLLILIIVNSINVLPLMLSPFLAGMALSFEFSRILGLVVSFIGYIVIYAISVAHHKKLSKRLG